MDKQLWVHPTQRKRGPTTTPTVSIHTVYSLSKSHIEHRQIRHSKMPGKVKAYELQSKCVLDCTGKWVDLLNVFRIGPRRTWLNSFKSSRENSFHFEYRRLRVGMLPSWQRCASETQCSSFTYWLCILRYLATPSESQSPVSSQSWTKKHDKTCVNCTKARSMHLLISARRRRAPSGDDWLGYVAILLFYIMGMLITPSFSTRVHDEQLSSIRRIFTSLCASTPSRHDAQWELVHYGYFLMCSLPAYAIYSGSKLALIWTCNRGSW